MLPESLIKILQQDYERTAQHIRLLESTNDKIVGFGITIVVAGFTYGIQSKIDEVFFFLPIAFIGVFLYATLQYMNLFWLGGYNHALEDKINLLAGETLVHWESLIQSSRRRMSLNNLSLVSIYLLVFVGIAAYSFFRIFRAQGLVLGIVFGAVVLFFSILLLVAVRRMLGAYDQSYQESKKALGLQ